MNETLGLTNRETMVLHYLMRGHTCKEIAGLMDIGAKPVHCHKRNVERKLGVSGDVMLTKACIRLGLTSAEAA